MYYEVIHWDEFGGTNACVRVAYISPKKSPFMVDNVGDTKWVNRSHLNKYFERVTKGQMLASIALFGDNDERR
jgi:hypothetical protein